MTSNYWDTREKLLYQNKSIFRL